MADRTIVPSRQNDRVQALGNPVETQYRSRNNSHMKAYFPGKPILLLVITMAVLGSAHAAMVTYTGGLLGVSANNATTAGVVGTSYGNIGKGQGNWAYESGAANAILALALGGSGTYEGQTANANNVYDYVGSYDGKQTTSGTTTTTIPAGWDFVIAKYDGKNAGYVLYYLGGTSQTIPAYPADYWTANPNKWMISGWTGFNSSSDSVNSGSVTSSVAVPEQSTIIAGNLLLLPLGASVFRILRKTRGAYLNLSLVQK
ncbi:MAG: hypothetical protein QM813_24810 [Verrucomicrobiota bacterium]